MAHVQTGGVAYLAHIGGLSSELVHITTSTKIGLLKQGKCSIIISRATGFA